MQLDHPRSLQVFQGGSELALGPESPTEVASDPTSDSVDSTVDVLAGVVDRFLQVETPRSHQYHREVLSPGLLPIIT